MNQLQDLQRVPSLVWGELQRACQRPAHAWRTPVLGNTSDGAPRLRTVVLRKSESNRRALRFYTDRRSAKWPLVEAGHFFTALFYDPKRKWQLLATGRPFVLPNEQEEHIWHQLTVPGRAAYASKSKPGTVLAEVGNGLPSGFFDFDLSATDYARANFAAFELVVDAFEVLQLHRAGHRRAEFSWIAASADWEGNWLVP